MRAERLADTKSAGPAVTTTSPAPAGANTGSAPEIAGWTRDEQRARAADERTGSPRWSANGWRPQVAAFEADKARLAEDARLLSSRCRRLAKAQAERERAGKTARRGKRALAGFFALDQQRTIALAAAATRGGPHQPVRRSTRCANSATSQRPIVIFSSAAG